jgi:hypothetical protein
MEFYWLWLIRQLSPMNTASLLTRTKMVGSPSSTPQSSYSNWLWPINIMLEIEDTSKDHNTVQYKLESRWKSFTFMSVQRQQSYSALVFEKTHHQCGIYMVVLIMTFAIWVWGYRWCSQCIWKILKNTERTRKNDPMSSATTLATQQVSHE